MSTDPAVRLDLGEIATLTLANPPLNLVTRPMLRHLMEAITELSAAPGVRVLTLRGGEARAFCAGSDMREFPELAANARDEKILIEDALLRGLAGLPFPTIAAIDGPALGGGLELALACDLRVARSGLELGLPECRIGGLAGTGAVRLTRLVGPSRARELLFTGGTVTAERAFEIGLVDRLVDDVASATDDLASEIAARGPMSNRFAKEISELALDDSRDAALDRAQVLQEQIFASRDLQEGAASFFAKWPARFTGS